MLNWNYKDPYRHSRGATSLINPLLLTHRDNLSCSVERKVSAFPKGVKFCKYLREVWNDYDINAKVNICRIEGCKCKL